MVRILAQQAAYGPPWTGRNRPSPRFVAVEFAAAVDDKRPDDLVFTMPGGSVMRLSNWRLGVPLACAVAVLKYRLYEIDRIISRTLAYAIVTGLLIGVYAGCRRSRISPGLRG
jgi:hypothetical protein